MDLKISPEDINRFVVDAIVTSTIGDAIKAQAEKAIAGLTRSYDNPIQEVVRQEVARQAALMVGEQFREPIRVAIQARIAEQITDDFVGKLLGKLWDRSFRES